MTSALLDYACRLNKARKYAPQLDVPTIIYMSAQFNTKPKLRRSGLRNHSTRT